MATTIEINKLKTIGGVISALKEFQKNNDSITNDPDFVIICRTVFERLGAEGEFDPTDTDGMILALESLPETTTATKGVGKDELLSDLLPEPKEAEVKMGSKSLNKAELEILLSEFEKHRSLKEARLVAEAVGRNRLLEGIKRGDILRTIEKKIEVESRLLDKGLSPIEADNLSDRVLETEQTVKAIVNENREVDEQTLGLAEEIESRANEASNTKEAIERAKSIATGNEDADDILRLLVETERASMAIDKEKVEIVDRAVAKISQEVNLTAIERNEVVRELRREVDKLATSPMVKVDQPALKIINQGSNGIKVVASEPQVTVRIREVITTKIPSSVETAIQESVKSAAAETTNLWKPNNNSAGDKVGGALAELTKSGAGPEQMKRLLELRYGASVKNVGKLEAEIGQEHAAKIEMGQRGFVENKVDQSVEQAHVIRAIIRSSSPVTETLQIVGKSRRMLGGVGEMKPLLDVADSLTKNKELGQSVEMIRKLVKAQENFDKWTGGIFNKVTGGAFNQVGQILKIEGMEQFGLALMNKLGLETMASHIATFGLEGGIKNMLVQIFSTGTVTAVKAGATAATEAAAGTVATAAGISTGPPGWILMAVFLATELIKKIGGSIYGKVRDFLGNILEMLGVGSAKSIDGAKDVLGNAVKYGGAMLGAVVSGILAIPALIGAGVMGTIVPVMLIVFAALIGYNLFQTASTQISSLVAPKSDQIPGVCIPVSDINGPNKKTGLTANCNANAPASSFPGINKDSFVDIASRWSAGGGANAAKCFNDVVCQALNAGINPAYALWIWLHESGASNYSIDGVADFGIAYKQRANFSEQLGALLKLDPASACPGLDYWLGFSTNFLTGGCDPNKTIGDVNGYDYKAEMESTWSMVSSEAMPSSIHVGPGGGKCGGGTDSGRPSADGQFICFGGSDTGPGSPGGSVYQPGATGLPGQNEVSDCDPPPAVNPASKVALTKQCGQPWSNKSLPGGSGTICSAGCGPTSVSMILRHGNASLTPDSVIFEPGSAYSHMDNDGSSLGQAQQELSRYLGPGAVQYDSTTRSCDVKAIGKWICAGKVVVILANFNGAGGHIFLGTSVQDGKIVSSDPYYTTRNPFNGTGFGYVAGGQPRECLVVDAAAIK